MIGHQGTSAVCGWAVVFCLIGVVAYLFNPGLAWYLLAVAGVNVLIGFAMEGK